MSIKNFNTVLQSVPTNPKFIDLTGQTFGKLYVIGYAGKKNERPLWLCKCDCGNHCFPNTQNLRRGTSQSCGCARDAKAIKHGFRYTTEYAAYQAAKDRCTNPKNKFFRHYGGRGIEFRFNSFEKFLTEIGAKPTASLTLDRIDKNGHYEKGNIRWADNPTQQRNRRNNREITAHGQTKHLCDWANEIGVKPSVILTRISRNWCVDCAVSLKIGVCPHKN